MAVKLQIGADIQAAQASLDVLEARLRKVSATAADIFRKASPQNQANILAAYGIYTGVGGAVLQPEKLLAQGATKLAKMARLDPGILPGTIDVNKLRAASRVLEPMLPGGSEWIGKLKGSLRSGGASHILQPEKLLEQGARKLAGMGPAFTGPDIKTGIMGGLAAMFSPWIGARLLNQAFGGFPILGGGGAAGGGKGIIGGLFGPGGMSGFGEWYVFIEAVGRAARALTQDFVEAIKRGSQLYLHAAMVATSPGRLSHLEKTFQMIGLPADTAQRLMAQGQFSQGVKMTPGGLQGTILGAGAGILGREELQAVRNLSKEIEEAWKATAMDAAVSAGAAKSLFNISMSLGGLKSAWQSFWEEIASSGEDTIRSLADLTANLLRLGTVIIALGRITDDMMKFSFTGNFEMLKKIPKDWKHLVDIVSGTSPESTNQRWLGAMGGSRPEAGWERLGLIIHGGLGGTDYARQTAQNTKKIADIMSGNWSGGVGHFGTPKTGGDWTSGVGHFSLPQLP